MALPVPTCPQCGTSRPNGMRFCGACGHDTRPRQSLLNVNDAGSLDVPEWPPYPTDYGKLATPLKPMRKIETADETLTPSDKVRQHLLQGEFYQGDDRKWKITDSGRDALQKTLEKTTDDIELQLLVIDLGDSCVVKVEKGVLSGPDRERIDPIYNPLDANVRCWVDIDAGFVWKVDKPFAEIRAAVDALADGEKPVPRIESYSTVDDLGKHNAYRIIWNEMGNEPCELTQPEFFALNELAGKPLPIWTPRKGEWSRIQAWESFIECPERGETDSGKIEQVDAPVEIWRYTLRGDLSE